MTSASDPQQTFLIPIMCEARLDICSSASIVKNPKLPTYFIQMSGIPGAGKSAVATEIAPMLSAVVLDHDDTKSAILRGGVSESEAGAASCEVVKALAERMVKQDISVVVHSPCLYKELLEHGVQTAKNCGASYRYIECQLADLDELDRRFRSRSARPSQIGSLEHEFRHAGATPRIAREFVIEWASCAQQRVRMYSW